MSEPRRLPLEAWGRAWLARLQAAADRTKVGRHAFEFLMFGIKQGWACLFGGAMVALLFLTHYFYPAHATLSRYDFLVLAAIAIQVAMLGFKLESFEELKVILAFHIVGTIMEIFKTSTGSWIYPEPSILHIAGVPLFSGFMYGSVGSYLARVWRIFDFRFTGYPPRWTTMVLGLAIYANFFTDHWGWDFRWAIYVAVGALYWRCSVWFKPDRKMHEMPMLIGFVLVAFFIWFAENIGTYSHAWLYPSQHQGWALVPISKIGSWLLLMIISFVMVSLVKKPVAIGAFANDVSVPERT